VDFLVRLEVVNHVSKMAVEQIAREMLHLSSKVHAYCTREVTSALGKN